MLLHLERRTPANMPSTIASHEASSPCPPVNGNAIKNGGSEAFPISNGRNTSFKQLSKPPTCVRGVDLAPVFSENILAKILQVAQRGLKTEGTLPAYPETVPQHQQATGQYEYRDSSFWTCGFFPGSIYCLLERAVKFPAQLTLPGWYKRDVYADLLTCGRHWSRALNEMSSRTDTHDMGFIVQPALQKDWELTGNLESLESVKNAAYALASRFDSATGAIRSWDEAINYRYTLTGKDENFLVIIDSMCNLDLLFYVGHTLGDMNLVSIAVSHADKVMKILLREDYSTFHLANLDPKTGSIKAQMTNQGWRDHSTWSRGQAWAIMGFAQTYLWTKDRKYLDTAIGCANMFLKRLRTATHHHKWVPAWDFDAPQENPSSPLRDTSAGVVAANGMLLIHQALTSQPDDIMRTMAFNTDFLTAALLIVQDTLDLSLDQDFASLTPNQISSEPPSQNSQRSLHVSVNPSRFEAILRNATANHNEHAHKRHSDHGLVYADYYLLEFGNKLCRMHLC